MTLILRVIPLVPLGLIVIAIFNWGTVRAASSQGALGALLIRWGVILTIASTVAILLVANRGDPSITGEEVIRGMGMGMVITSLLFGGAPDDNAEEQK